MNVIREGNRSRLCLEGELTVNNAASLRTQLLEVLGQGELIEIELDGVTAVDLAGLQLLCSAHRTAVEQGKSLTLKNQHVPALREARAKSGFVFHRSCRFNPAADCFWVGGMES